MTLTATVAAVSPGTGTPTGTVQFYNGTTALGSPDDTRRRGRHADDHDALTTGDNSITAEYSGDPNFVASTSPAVTVTLAATATSTTTVTFSPSSPVLWRQP